MGHNTQRIIAAPTVSNCLTDSRRELRASPSRVTKDSERNLMDTFRNIRDNEPTDMPSHFNQ